MIKSNIDIPSNPGVYLFKNGDKVLYIGKAKNLKNRVSQYFQRKDYPVISNLLNQSKNIEFIITEDEKDALHLEYNLIHRYQPPFNIRLKDDKSFPLIEITLEKSDQIEFPGIYFTRRTKGKNFYVGPIVSARKTRELIDIITRLFKLRTCTTSVFKKGTGCLFYYIDRCCAPCIGKISIEEYNKNINDTIVFLKGQKSKISEDLENRMKEFAAELKFEEAQKVKEDLDLIRSFKLESYISTVSKMDYDVISLFTDSTDNDCFIILFSVLQGRVKQKEFFNFNGLTTQPEELLKEFLLTFYRAENIPREIIVQQLPADKDFLEELFSEMSNHRITIKIPLKGSKRKMLELAVRNMNLFVRKSKYKQLGERLQKTLKLDRFPSSIEGYDISHFSERDRVGAVVAFFNGKPQKKNYRNYIIKQASEGDTEALKEVLTRRFKKLEKHPDLLLIDGGKGQLSAAMEIKEKCKINSDVVSIAKREERIFLEKGGSVIFPEDSPERFLFQEIRDEVHRRAITHHRKRREKI